MNKKFAIYFKHDSEKLTLDAHHFSFDGGEVKFFKAETTVDPEIYVAADSVAAVDSSIAVKREPSRSVSTFTDSAMPWRVVRIYRQTPLNFSIFRLTSH